MKKDEEKETYITRKREKERPERRNVAENAAWRPWHENITF